MPYCEVVKPINWWVKAEAGSSGHVVANLRKVQVGEQVEIPDSVYAEFHDRFVLARRPTVHAPTPQADVPRETTAVPKPAKPAAKPKRAPTALAALNALCKDKLGKGFKLGTPKETMIEALIAAGHEVPEELRGGHANPTG